MVRADRGSRACENSMSWSTSWRARRPSYPSTFRLVGRLLALVLLSASFGSGAERVYDLRHPGRGSARFSILPLLRIRRVRSEHRPVAAVRRGRRWRWPGRLYRECAEARRSRSLRPGRGRCGACVRAGRVAPRRDDSPGRRRTVGAISRRPGRHVRSRSAIRSRRSGTSTAMDSASSPSGCRFGRGRGVASAGVVFVVYGAAEFPRDVSLADIEASGLRVATVFLTDPVRQLSRNSPGRRHRR